MTTRVVKTDKSSRTSKNGKAPSALNGNGKNNRSTQPTAADVKTDSKRQRRERLLGERGSAEAELTRLHEQMQIEIEHDTDEGDPDVYEREKLLAVIRTMEDKIASIDDALKALDHGNYGICERCGTQIGVERLKAVPGTTHCVKCKAETEKMLKRGFTPE